MPKHKRQYIREQIIASLAASSELSTLNPPLVAIEAGRVVPVDDAALPRILVYLRGETASDENVLDSPKTYRLEAELVIEYVERVVLSAGPPEDHLDNVAESMQQAAEKIEKTRALDLVRSMDYSGTDVEISLDGARPTCSIVLRYALEYTREAAFYDQSDDLLSAGIEYLEGDSSPEDNPTDEISFPIPPS